MTMPPVTGSAVTSRTTAVQQGAVRALCDRLDVVLAQMRAIRLGTPTQEIRRE